MASRVTSSVSAVITMDRPAGRQPLSGCWLTLRTIDRRVLPRMIDWDAYERTRNVSLFRNRSAPVG